MKKLLLSLILILLIFPLSKAQENDPALLSLDRIFLHGEFIQRGIGQIQWYKGGEAYTQVVASSEIRGAEDIIKYDTQSGDAETWVSAKDLIPAGSDRPLRIAAYKGLANESQVLIFTNTRRVWRTNTRGDYWVFNRESKELRKLGGDLPESSLMFSKFAPDGKSVAYVSGNNLYLESWENKEVNALTKDGSRNIINGTFDWVYEEEFFCQDGFRWSPDSRKIAYWQLDAAGTGIFYMINNTDSVYSRPIPIEYPKVGDKPSGARIGILDIKTQRTLWLKIPGEARDNYLPRLQWIGEKVLVQQLNRKQNHLKLWMCDTESGEAELVYEEKDKAWVDIFHMDASSPRGMRDYQLVDDGDAVLRLADKDTWRHLYKIALDGSGVKDMSPADYDLARTYELSGDASSIYTIASPDNPTQRYLYELSLKGKGKSKRLTPEKYSGINQYNISPSGAFAIHTHSNANTPNSYHLISLPDHNIIRSLQDNAAYKEKLASLDLPSYEFFSVETEDGVIMEGKMMKPTVFNPGNKYPVLFNLYGEPAGQTAVDRWNGNLWHAMLAQKGYIVLTLDNRGTPSLKGREWRKSIYRKIGILNSHDQAMAAKKIAEWPFVDKDRMAVWGWSGGGTMTLNLLFRYPGLFSTGMSVAPVANQLLYDNIYQERYMGLPQENMEDFVEGSPLTYAKNLEDNLLLVHGTGDDNVHYQNSEVLINELIKHNKQFQVMPYPNRSHGIYEGPNTRRHLYTLLTQYLLRNCPPNVEED
ncbi:MAG: DPP IV N-terminal domain-containing protein [Bacteroidota bacterium]